MIKRLFCLLMIALPLMASAEDVVVDGIKYHIDINTLTADVIGSVDNEEKCIYIPSSITVETVITLTYKVTSIADGAFQNHQMELLNLPESLKMIGNYAFEKCESLSDVIVPTGVMKIGDYAFAYCKKAKTIILGEGTKTIGRGAFLGSGLEHLYICATQIPETSPNDLGTPDNADWAMLTLHVPSNLVEDYKKSNQPYWSDIKDENIVAMPDQRFEEVISGGIKYSLDMLTQKAEVIGYGDDAAKNIIIPSVIEADGKTYPVTSIGQGALSYNDNIVSLAVSEGVITIGDMAFSGCHSLLELFLPNSVTTIGSYAFERCTHLNSLTIGTGIRSIGHDAFVETGSLEDFYIYAPRIPQTYVSRSDNPNNELTSSVVLHVPASLVEEYKNTDLPNWRRVNDSFILSLPKGDIEEMMQGNCRYRINKTKGTAELVRVMEDAADIKFEGTIEKDGHSYPVTNIGPNAFMLLDAEVEHTVTLPETLTTIGERAFAKSNFPVVHIPNSVTSIKEYAFHAHWKKNMGLREIHIGEGIKEIADLALIGSMLLTDIYIYANEMPLAGMYSLFPEAYIDYSDQLTLHVPEALVEVYRNSNELPWTGFKKEKIVAIGSSSISGVHNSPLGESFYTLDGHKLSSPTKGINIIRQSDGTTRKVIVK